MNIRMKLLRKKKGITFDVLAAETGMTKSYLSKVERELSKPSISTALKLSKALGVSVEELFSVGLSTDSEYHLERADNRRQPADGQSALNYVMLTRQAAERNLLAFMLCPDDEFSDSNFKEHSGEEFMFVHKGAVEVDLMDQKIILNTGDSFSFNGLKPHRIRSHGGRNAELLVIISPASDLLSE